MSLPPSLERDGFISPTKLYTAKKYRGLMIDIEGESGTGKTEFMMSCPEPVAIIGVDSQVHAPLDNPNPPSSRGKDLAIFPIDAPIDSGAENQSKDAFLKYWFKFTGALYKGLDNQDVRTVGIDGDSDSYELQRMAEFGKLSGVAQLDYKNINTVRKTLYKRAYDSGKIIVATSKVKEVWVNVYEEDGVTKKLTKRGNEVREPSGEFKIEGYANREYLWDVRLRGIFEPKRINSLTKKEVPMRWGMQIIRCKANRSLEGDTLYGSDCCFRGLVEYIYPNIPIAKWGL